jgi:ribonuclease R
MTKESFSSKKSEKLSENLSKVILQFLSGKKYIPLSTTALLKRLKIPSSFHSICKQIIADLLQEGIIEVSKKKLTLKRAAPEVIRGVLRMHPRGFGFVIPDHPAECPQDIFIPKHQTDNAVDGDNVEVAINPNSNWEKGPEGKILSILKRGRTHLAGTVRDIDQQGVIFAHVPILGIEKPVLVHTEKDTRLKVGDRIIMKVVEWGDQNNPTTTEMSYYIGHISDPSCDIAAAIEEFDLHNQFPKTVIEEAKAFGKKVPTKDLKGRKNFSEINAITIDPESAKDFDDALSLSVDKKGVYHLGVHIADVAHYVHPFSTLDLEAQNRCNSTYFPGVCLPMLPHELSSNLCSLLPNVIRLTVSVLMDFDKEGNLLKHKILRSFIKSAKRFTYEEAKLVIDGKKKSPHSSSLKLMVELCHLLKKKRYERGSIDFSMPEIVVEVDEQGRPFNVKKVEYDISHQLVEEFMLKANEIVAMHLTKEEKPLLYRIHEQPSQDNIQDFYSLARSFGFQLPENPTNQDLQTLFQQAKKTPFAELLSVAFIRSMRLAFYSSENVGHYGLALEHYCHFTSPIRRYTDLVTQRILFNEHEETTSLEQIALKCSEQERISFRAETSVKLLKKLRLLNHYLKEDPYREYQAVVTRIKPFGLFFETRDLMLEGFLHISELENDFFLFDPKRNVLFGKSTGKRHFLGESVQVRLRAVDFILLESKWELVTKLPRHPSSRARKNRFKK